MTTLRQIEANRRNAKLSTGPKTEQGKQASRGNSTTHGLSGAGVVRTEDEADRIAERIDLWGVNFHPANDYDDWLLGQAVMLSVRLERCWANDLALRMLASERAGSGWEEDRRLAAVELGARLAKQPERIAWRLRRTRQGCDWLIGRWEALAALVRGGHDWTEAQRDLALDLLGTPEELREGPTRIDPDDVSGVELRAARLAVAESEVAELTALRDESLADLDESERDAAERGVFPELDPAVLLTMRYESAASRRMHWALGELRKRKPPEAVAGTSRPRAASLLAPHAHPAPEDSSPGDCRGTLPRDSRGPALASDPKPPEPPAATEPVASSPAPADPILPPVTATPSASLRFDAAPAPSAITSPSIPHQKGMASLFASSGAPAGNRRDRRAQTSRGRRG